METIVALENITQKFGDFAALEGVSLRVNKGDIHAVVGENGAGKTTLMRILYGALSPTEGTLHVRGQAKKYRSSREAIADRIGMVSQHYAIIPELTCLQNLMLGAEPGPWINPKRAEVQAEGLAERMGFQFDWHASSASLGPAGAQKLEILKLLWRNAEIMILDEPTAMLSPADADALFASLQRLAGEGSTVILVTHRLPEVTEFCQEVTVLRGGKQVASRAVEGLSKPELAELIVGRALREFAPREVNATKVVLNVQDWSIKGDRGDVAVKRASFQVREGELLGVAGVDGNGQRELFHALMGTRRSHQGLASLSGEALDTMSTRQRIAKGVRLIAEDRHSEAIVEEWSLEENAVLGYQRLEAYSTGGGLNVDAIRGRTEHFVARFQTKCNSITQPIGSLSGGNQQRFVTARALDGEPKLILAFQPTRGLDIDASRAVYSGIREECAKGAGALVVSFDLDELLEFCDRIVVLNGGVLHAAPSKDRAAIGRLMVGAE